MMAFLQETCQDCVEESRKSRGLANPRVEDEAGKDMGYTGTVSVGIEEENSSRSLTYILLYPGIAAS